MLFIIKSPPTKKLLSFLTKFWQFFLTLAIYSRRNLISGEGDTIFHRLVSFYETFLSHQGRNVRKIIFSRRTTKKIQTYKL